jgi:Leucine-rich repeat (LRR) protein
MSDIQESIPAAAEAKKEPRRRWRFQYSLRTLLIFVSIVGVLCGWLGMFLQRVRHQRNVVVQIKTLGGEVIYDYQIAGMQAGNFPASPPGPRIIRWILGDDVFAYVGAVYFKTPVNNKDLPQLQELTHLKGVYLSSPGITDEWLKIISEIPNLQWLSLLVDKNITEEGLGRIKNIKTLEALSLCGAAVNDSTLMQCEKLANLNFLVLKETSVTDDGMENLVRLSQLHQLEIFKNRGITDVSMIGQLTNLESLKIVSNSTIDKGFNQLKDLRKLINLSIVSTPLNDDNMKFLDDLKELRELILAETQITDSGLVHLQASKNLVVLDLGHTKISDLGLKNLKSLSNLEYLDIRNTNITSSGLEHLKYLTKLKSLNVGQNITKSDLSELRISLPKCTIDIIAPDEKSAETLEPIKEK